MVEIVFRNLAENLWIDYCIQQPITLWAFLKNVVFRIGGVAFSALYPLIGGLLTQLRPVGARAR